MSRPRLIAACAVGVLLLGGVADAAPRHRVEPGETLEHVARVYGCEVDAVLRANDLDTTIVPVGTLVTIPPCRRAAAPRRRHAAAPMAAAPTSPIDDLPTGRDVEDDAEREADDTTGARARARARRAIAAIDGATDDDPDLADATVATTRDGAGPPGQSLGVPWHGALRAPTPLPRGDGYVLRRPSRAFGAAHVVAQVQAAIAAVRALRPEVHDLAIGDLSAPEGGRLARHRSHQSGLDVDIGFYFTRVPDGYPAEFAPASRDLDLEATWSLILAFARTASRPDGVEVIFLDYDVQRRLYAWARAHGTRDDDLAFLLQCAHGRDERAGLVRHEPSHTDHLHVRFRAAPATR